MGIPLASNFDVGSAIPLDSRQQVADQTARDAISNRWEGMTVYVVADGITYQLVGGTTNSDWVEVGSGGAGGVGGTDILFAETFDDLADFTGFTTADNCLLDAISPLHGAQSVTMDHTVSVATLSKTVAVEPKFLGKQIKFSVDVNSTATAGNVVLTVVDESNLTTILNQEPLSLTAPGSVKSEFFFTLPDGCSSFSWTIEGLVDAAGSTIIDDVVAELYVTTSVLDQTVTITTPVVTDWTNFTPSGGWTTNATYTGKWKRTGVMLEVEYLVSLSGGPSGGTLSFTLPNGLTIDTTKLVASTVGDILDGDGFAQDGGGFKTPLLPTLVSSTQVGATIHYDQTGSGANYTIVVNAVNGTTPITFGSGDSVFLRVKVPITGWSATEDTNYTIPLTMNGIIQDSDSEIYCSGGTGYGSTYTRVRRLGTATTTGNALTYTDDPATGSKITVNESGTYHVVYKDTFSTVTYMSITKNINNTTDGTTSGIDLTDKSKVLATQYTDTATAIYTASATVYLNAGDTLHAHTNNGQTVSSSGVYSSFRVSKIGTLKQININNNQKATIPTSELRFEGASARGAVATAIVKFDTQAKLSGSAFTVTNTANDGTAIRMLKAGKLDVSSSLVSASGQAMFISLNQVDLTNIPTGTEALATDGFDAGSTRSSCSWSGHVKDGDVIRISCSSTPTANSRNSLNLLFQEQQVQVSVSNTLPQFSEDDLVVKAENNGGTAVTLDVTNIPFTTTVLDTTGGAWNGTQFTVPETGVYSIAVHVAFTANGSRAVHLWKNGSFYRRIGELAASGSTQTHHGFIQERFTKGETLTIRINGGSGTLLSTVLYHYIEINRVGKPNVTGVDVTPFVNIPRAEKASARIRAVAGRGSTDTYIAYYNGTVDYTGTAGLFTVASSATLGTTITANRNGYMTINAMIVSSATGARVGISKNHSSRTTYPTIEEDVTINDFRSMVATGDNVQITAADIPVKAGDVLRVYSDNAISSSGRSNLLVTMEAESPNIITPIETFSTDTAPLTYASSSQYTLSTLANAPVGTFITFTYTAGNNTRTQTTTAPTQTTADMAANGILLTRRAYNTTGSAATPPYFAIQIGKGMKGSNIKAYQNTAKTDAIYYDYRVVSSSEEYGTNISYNERTGILVLDAAMGTVANTTRGLGINEAGAGVVAAYFTVDASKNPALAGLGLKPVVMRVGNSAGTSIPNVTWTTVVWNSSKVFDTTNSMNTSTGVWTCPETGYYQCSSGTYFASSAWTAGTFIWTAFVKNSSSWVSYGPFVTADRTASYELSCSNSSALYLTKGETLELRVYQNRGGATSLYADSTMNYFSIAKVNL